jgi:hypothetical protein
MDCINYCMRQDGEHRWCHDEETMGLLLESVGFVEVQRRKFDPELDQEERREGGLFMKCKKAGRVGDSHLSTSRTVKASSIDHGSRIAFDPQ